MCRYRFGRVGSEEQTLLADELPVFTADNSLWRMTSVRSVFRSSPAPGFFDPAPSMSLFLVRPVTTQFPDYPGADSEEPPPEPLEIWCGQGQFRHPLRIGRWFP